MISQQIVHIFNWASWSSVFAGLVSGLAVATVLAVLGVALGFTVIKPSEDEPMSGLGRTFGIWSAISIILSLGASGFVAGLFAAQHGAAHGFLAWATMTVAAMFIGGSAMSAAVRTVGSAMKSVGDKAASAAGSLGRGAAHLAGESFVDLREHININIDQEKLANSALGVLRDTGIESLQPEKLKGQFAEVRADLRSLLHKLSLNPSHYEQIISEFLEIEKNRVFGLTKDIDKAEAVKRLMEKRGIPGEEAETMLNNALDAYHQAVDKAKETLEDAREQARAAGEYLKAKADKAREKADKLSTMAAKTALCGGVSMILAAFVSMGAGWLGVHCFNNWYAISTVILN